MQSYVGALLETAEIDNADDECRNTEDALVQNAQDK
jgi:hypothetical protein